MLARCGLLVFAVSIAPALGAACMTGSQPSPAAPEPAAAATPAAAEPAGGCAIEGAWQNTTPDVGASTITIARQGDGSYKATESGMGNFDGTATFKGHALRVDFKTGAGYAGWYEWTLDDSCSGGEGKLVFTAGGQGEHTSSVKRGP